MDDLIESDCPKHGLDRHICVHEAGHAVAAIDNGLVPFRAVVVYEEADAPRFMSGLAQAAAAIDVGPDPSAWVPDPLGSVRFVMGGVAAEMAELGDSIPGGWDQDIKVWRRGSGSLDRQTEQELADFIGMPMHHVWDECQAWAEANVSRIESVADALAGHEPPWELLREDVEAILGRAGVGGRA